MRKIYDAVIIGSGAAGYSAADWLYKENITDIAVITENRLWGTSRNTGSDKQTYYKISMDGFSQDSPYKMACDICSLGSCDGEKAYLQAVNSAKCFLRLCEYGVGFPSDEFGGYPGYKTDHDSTTRATSVGPLTSKVMTQRLEDTVINKNKTALLDNRQVIKIITENRRVSGVAVLNGETSAVEVIAARNVIVATGAPACVYESSVYPHSQHGMTGVLVDAGVRLCNFSQWQYGLSSVDFRWNVSGSFMQVVPRFVSVDENGEETEFLKDYFGSAEKANNYVFLKGYQWPFSFDRMEQSSGIDVAVHEQMKLGRQVYLDYTRNPEGFSFDLLSVEARNYLESTGATQATPIERLRALNSKAIDVYLRQGIDIGKDKLKIAVCAQHNNGGVYTDKNYQTDVQGLYVIGEAAGSFGLTRPGGSALNDTQVGGLVCAKHIAGKEKCGGDAEILDTVEKELSALIKLISIDESVDYSFIKSAMSECAAFMRENEKCLELLGKINGILESYPKKHRSVSGYFYDLDMLISAKALLESITCEMPLTGSRGGSVFIKDGKILPENTHYRQYLTLTQSGEVSFIKAAPVPQVSAPFESYLSKIDESELTEVTV